MKKPAEDRRVSATSEFRSFLKMIFKDFSRTFKDKVSIFHEPFDNINKEKVGE